MSKKFKTVWSTGYKIPHVRTTNVTIRQSLRRVVLFHLVVLPIAPRDRSQKNRCSLRHGNMAVIDESL